MNAYIVDGVRTPIGNFGGTLAPIRTDDLAALPIIKLMERQSGLDPSAVADVLMGCANQAGEDNRNIARMALLLAGLPQSVPGGVWVGAEVWRGLGWWPWACCCKERLCACVDSMLPRTRMQPDLLSR